MYQETMISHELQKIYNLSVNEYCVLDYIHKMGLKHGGASEIDITDIQDKLGYSRASAYNMINSLKEKDLLYLSDKREVVLNTLVKENFDEIIPRIRENICIKLSANMCAWDEDADLVKEYEIDIMSNEIKIGSVSLCLLSRHVEDFLSLLDETGDRSHFNKYFTLGGDFINEIVNNHKPIFGDLYDCDILLIEKLNLDSAYRGYKIIPNVLNSIYSLLNFDIRDLPVFLHAFPLQYSLSDENLDEELLEKDTKSLIDYYKKIGFSVLSDKENDGVMIGTTCRILRYKNNDNCKD